MSETVTMTLTEFLLARIAEDEAVARVLLYTDAQDVVIRMRNGVEAVPPLTTLPALRRRILAECAAKRRIVELHTSGDAWCDHCDPLTGFDDCPTLRALASVYAEHPDFQEEWHV